MGEAPKRVQSKRTKGWRMPPNTVKVTRPGKWGNPFAIGTSRCDGKAAAFVCEKVEDAATAVAFFRDMLAIRERDYPSQTEIIGQLRGKNLACWCKEGDPCHADVLLEIANPPDA